MNYCRLKFFFLAPLKVLYPVMLRLRIVHEGDARLHYVEQSISHIKQTLIIQMKERVLVAVYP